MNPLLKKMHITKIYTELELESHDDESETKKLISYKDIFIIKTTEGLPINQTIMEGNAGFGKSTLIGKIAYDWAMRVALKKYKLVFVLKMHALEQTSDLIDAIYNQLLNEDTDIDKSYLRSYIHDNPGKVLILLDGFDELMTTTLSETSFGTILKILNRKRSRGCSVVVTTRPSHFHTLVGGDSLVQQPYNHVKVLGFQAGNIEKYVQKFYSQEHDNDNKARELVQKIQSSDALSGLVKSPMLLFLICLLWKEESTLPQTMSRLYRKALRFIFERKEKQMQEDEVLRVVTEIGKVALEGLLSPQQCLSFPEKEFEKSVLDTAIRAGILTSQKVQKGLETHNSVQFCHKTFQEYCAAMYLKSLLEEDAVKFHDKIGSKNNLSDLDYLLRFCCGDNEATTSTIIQILQKRIPGDHSLALNCFFECQSKKLPAVNFVTSVVTDKLRIQGYDNWSLNAFMYFLKLVSDQTKGTGDAPLDKVQKFVIQRCNLQNCLTELLGCMSRMSKLSVLKLKYISGLEGSGSWAPHMQHIHIHKLCLQQCKLTGEDVKHIALSTVVKLDLSHNKGLGGSSDLWCPRLRRMQKLQKLNLGHCALKRDDVRHIATLADLVNLNLSHNESFGGMAELWSDEEHSVAQMKSLKKLNLSECSLKGEDVEHIVLSLSDMTNLKKLHLSHNVELSRSAKSWSKHLHDLKHLQELILDDCNIATNDLKYIVTSVGRMNNLVRCSVYNNVHPNLTYELIIEQTKLQIRGCSLTNTNLAAILDSVSEKSVLDELELSEFESLGSTVSWSSHLNHFRHLKLLVLNCCKLRSADIRNIEMQLMEMPNLENLYLTGNDLLKGDAKSWFPHLQRHETLKMLALSDCNLTREDWDYITESVGSNGEVEDCTVNFK